MRRMLTKLQTETFNKASDKIKDYEASITANGFAPFPMVATSLGAISFGLTKKNKCQLLLDDDPVSGVKAEIRVSLVEELTALGLLE